MEKTYITEEILKQSIQTFKVNMWEVKILPRDIIMSKKEKDILASYAREWPSSFNELHCNWFRNEFDVPSFHIRFDYVLDTNGNPCIFEIEDRPAGLELSALLKLSTFNEFVSALKSYSQYAGKPIGICVSPGRMFNSDDYAWVQRVKDIANFKVVLGDMPHNPETHLWLVRSLRVERAYYELTPYSLSTIEFEGDKSYGSRMGLWNEIKDADEIDWSVPFVAKPDAGCRCENIHLFKPGMSHNGFSTKKKVTDAITSGDVSYIQPYYAPEAHSFLPSGYQFIRRCHALYSVDKKQYQIIGGYWEARPLCHKVHGASDAICGPLVLPE